MKLQQWQAQMIVTLLTCFITSITTVLVAYIDKMSDYVPLPEAEQHEPMVEHREIYDNEGNMIMRQECHGEGCGGITHDGDGGFSKGDPPPEPPPPMDGDYEEEPPPSIMIPGDEPTVGFVSHEDEELQRRPVDVIREMPQPRRRLSLVLVAGCAFGGIFVMLQLVMWLMHRHKRIKFEVSRPEFW